MARVYTQTNMTVPCGVIPACSGATMLASTIQSRMEEGGTPGTVEQTVALPTNNAFRGFFVIESPATGEEVWPAGSWVARFNITLAQNDTFLREVHVCRVNSSCGTVESVGSETGLAVSLAGGGVFNRTISGSESVGSADDRIYIVVVASNDHAHTTRNVGVTPNQEIDTPLPAAAEPEVMDADPSSYVVTGAEAETQRTYLQDADPSSYVVTGAEAETDQEVGWQIAGETAAGITTFRYDELTPGTTYELGIVSFDGDFESEMVTTQGTTLQDSIVVDADSGSYAVTGSEAGTLHDRSTISDSGSYSVSGAEAGTLHARIQSAESGDFSLQGEAAETLLRHVLGTEAGAYTVDGAEAETLLGRVLDGDPGAYVVSGSEATFSRTHVMDAGSGAYSAAGAAADTETTGAFRVDADPGSHVVTGLPVDTLRAHAQVASPGPYSQTGAEAETLLGRVLDADTGIHSVTGVTADTATLGAVRLDVEPGAYALTGEEVVTIHEAETQVLRWTATHEFEGLAVVGAATAHEALSDDDPDSYVTREP